MGGGDVRAADDAALRERLTSLEIPFEVGGKGAAAPALYERLNEMIASGKVLCLDVPAGTNPALARAAGVMLKQAWLQTLLLLPAVFLCDGHQTFATVGGDRQHPVRPGRQDESQLQPVGADAARRCYLKPDFLPQDRPYWRVCEVGEL